MDILEQDEQSNHDFIMAEYHSSLIYHSQKVASSILIEMAKMGLDQQKIAVCCDTVVAISKAVNTYKISGDKSQLMDDIWDLRHTVTDLGPAGLMLHRNLDDLLGELH